MRVKLLLLSLALLIAVAPRIFSQDSTPSLRGAPSRSSESPETEAEEKMRHAMEKKQNEDRQAQLKRDTDKLVELSNELQQYVNKTSPNVLSIDVIKKAEEIEKLAHSVKEKMKGS